MTVIIGERVGAIICSDPDRKTVTFAGYRVYKGDKNVPAGFFHDMRLKNPCIKLDNGETIWGCECWWASEEKIKEIMERFIARGYTVIDYKRGD